MSCSVGKGVHAQVLLYGLAVLGRVWSRRLPRPLSAPLSRPACPPLSPCLVPRLSPVSGALYVSSRARPSDGRKDMPLASLLTWQSGKMHIIYVMIVLFIRPLPRLLLLDVEAAPAGTFRVG